ncbi:MAG TPA: site-specific recombinase [Pseudomonadales bacterium]|nr:site-specific recombinase [Pseudomonadales bacterium]
MVVHTAVSSDLPVPHLVAVDDALNSIATDTSDDPLLAVVTLVQALRPQKRGNAEEAVQRWQHMNALLAATPDYRHSLRNAVVKLLASRHQVSFYTESGLLPNSGFFSELNRKIAHKFLPEPCDDSDLRSCVSRIFSRSDDNIWMAAIPAEQRQAFWALLEIHASEDIESLHAIIEQMIESLLVLSHRICAMGLEPEMLRAYPRLRDNESPFIAMNIELINFIADFRRGFNDEASQDDGNHLLVLLDQCAETVKKAHRSSMRLGTSMTLSFLLTRLSQHLDRLQLLIRVLTVRFRPESPTELVECWTEFLSESLEGERTHNSVSQHFSNLLGMMALRITDNAAHTGEHYIANNAQEWRNMLLKASGAGFFIAILALLKILSGHWQLGASTQAWFNALLYASGFAIIYMLHFVIATKQPAMTAATLAGSISQTRGRLHEIEKIVDLVVDTFRSQIAAIAGNIGIAFPLAILLSVALDTHLGEHAVGSEKALYLLADLNPVHSLALFHAAIAGVWLFLTGLVSGYLDNRAAYTQLHLRIAQLPWLQACIGKRGATAAGTYIADNAGGLGGNIFFGLMLGLTPLLGAVLGLPLDIRHIAFSSANLGYALIALDFDIPALAILSAACGVLLVGFVNLSVSFALALWVAMRSRKVSMYMLVPVLPRLWQRLREHPESFLFPSA